MNYRKVLLIIFIIARNATALHVLKQTNFFFYHAKTSMMASLEQNMTQLKSATKRPWIQKLACLLAPSGKNTNTFFLNNNCQISVLSHELCNWGISPHLKGPCKRTQLVPTTPNNVGCCWPTMLRPFAWALRPMQTDAVSANNSQHSWVLFANNVASVCMGLKV